MDDNTAYKWINGTGAAVNAVSFLFLHKPAISVALKAASFGLNAASMKMNRKAGYDDIVKGYKGVFGLDAMAAFCLSYELPNLGGVLTGLIGFFQFTNVKTGLAPLP